jgi:hypothetical protein
VRVGVLEQETRKNSWLPIQGEKEALAARRGADPPEANPYCQPCWLALRGACV